MPEYVWLTEERTWAQLVSLSGHFAVVKYVRGGIDYEVCVPRDEFEYGEEESDIDDTD